MFNIKSKILSGSKKTKNSINDQETKKENLIKLPEKQEGILIQTPKEALEKEKDEGSSFYPMFYRRFAKRAEFFFPRFINLKPKIKKSGLGVHYEAYVCALLGLSFLMGVIGLGIGTGISLAVTLDPPAFEIFLPIMMGVVLSNVTFGFMYYYPKLAIKGRQTRILGELPYYIGYMATLSASGLTLEGVFKAIAKEQSKEEIVKDAKMLVRDLEIMGLDVINSLKEMIDRAPSGPYAEMLEGLISTVETGGNLKEYFISTAKVQLEEKKLLLRKMTSSLGIVAEMYTILLIVFPLLAAIMLSIMAMMTPNLGGFSLTTLMKLLTYVFVPFLGILMLLMIDSMVPKR